MRNVLLVFVMLALICGTGCNSGSPAASAPSTAPHDSPSNLRLPVTVEGKVGYIDGTGKLVINPQFEFYGSPFSEGLAMMCVGECDWEHQMGYRYNKDFTREKLEQRFKYGFIDEAGKLVINPMFEGASSFREGLAAVCVGKGCYGGLLNEEEKKWGYIDKTGATVIAPQFDQTYDFHEGLAGVSMGKKWGYIDKAGKFLINPQFDWVGDFDHGIAPVTIRRGQSDPGRSGYIDKTGKYIWQPSN